MRNPCIVGGSIIYKTINGGTSWVKVFDRANGNLSAAKCINFITPDKGFVCSSFGILFRTIDGGKTWTDQTISSLGSNVTLEKIEFIDELHGWISGTMGTLLKTTDGGNTWNIIHSNADVTLSLYKYGSPDIAVISQNELFTTNGSLLKSTDAGTSWAASEGILNQGTSLTMKDRDEAFCLVKPGSMAHTYDGGITWTLFTLNTYGSLVGYFVKYGHTLYGYTPGDNKVYKYNKSW
jgi:photosystem II stability/assembly factor-like uncharacterized protein